MEEKESRPSEVHSELSLGMEWIGPKWLPLLLPICVGGSLPLHS